jgi:TetR/AcrR family transcriptional regulator, transcriptional repressor for nem operon
MGRSSRAEADAHRAQVVAEASKLLRERGESVSVQDVMAAAGMTHGGFYKHFGSKDELLGVAAAAAFEELNGWIEQTIADAPEASQAWHALIDGYLSTRHRDDPGAGCASCALAADTIRAPENSPLRKAYAEGLDASISLVEQCEDAGDADARRQAVIDFATMVGALTLSRAARGTALSEEILATVRDSLDQRR